MASSVITRGSAAAMLVVLALGGPAAAQRRAAGSSDWCSQENWGDDRQGFCEVREYSVPASGGTLTVDASPNGGISVEGSSRGDVFVQARVVATATTEAEARAIASRVQVTATAVRVDAEGPRNLERRESWSVSYRVAAPTATPLTLRTTNGGITIDAIDSRVELKTTNGGLKLTRMGAPRGAVSVQRAPGGCNDERQRANRLPRHRAGHDR